MPVARAEDFVWLLGLGLLCNCFSHLLSSILVPSLATVEATLIAGEEEEAMEIVREGMAPAVRSHSMFFHLHLKLCSRVLNTY